MPTARVKKVAQARAAAGRFKDTFNLTLAISVCERIALGETLTGICKEPGMPDRGTFRSWVLRDENLRRAYDAARELKAASLFDEALDIARDLKNGTYDNAKVRALQVAIDTLKWAAGKLNPREYGDKAPPTPIMAVVIRTSLDLGDAGRGLAPALGENLYSLKATLPLPAPAPAQTAEDGAGGQSEPGERRPSP